MLYKNINCQFFIFNDVNGRTVTKITKMIDKQSFYQLASVGPVLNPKKVLVSRIYDEPMTAHVCINVSPTGTAFHGDDGAAIDNANVIDMNSLGPSPSMTLSGDIQKDQNGPHQRDILGAETNIASSEDAGARRFDPSSVPLGDCVCETVGESSGAPPETNFGADGESAAETGVKPLAGDGGDGRAQKDDENEHGTEGGEGTLYEPFRVPGNGAVTAAPADPSPVGVFSSVKSLGAQSDAELSIDDGKLGLGIDAADGWYGGDSCAPAEENQAALRNDVAKGLAGKGSSTSAVDEENVGEDSTLSRPVVAEESHLDRLVELTLKNAEMQSSRDHLSNQHRIVQEENMLLQEQITLLAQEREEALAQVGELRSVFRHSRENARECSTQRARLRVEVERLQAENGWLKETQRNIKEENKQLREGFENAQNSLEHLMTTVEQLTKERDNMGACLVHNEGRDKCTQYEECKCNETGRDAEMDDNRYLAYESFKILGRRNDSENPPKVLGISKEGFIKTLRHSFGIGRVSNIGGGVAIRSMQHSWQPDRAESIPDGSELKTALSSGDLRSPGQEQRDPVAKGGVRRNELFGNACQDEAGGGMSKSELSDQYHNSWQHELKLEAHHSHVEVLAADGMKRGTVLPKHQLRKNDFSSVSGRNLTLQKKAWAVEEESCPILGEGAYASATAVGKKPSFWPFGGSRNRTASGREKSNRDSGGDSEEDSISVTDCDIVIRQDRSNHVVTNS